MTNQTIPLRGEHTTVILLAAAQACFLSAVIIIFTSAGLVGLVLSTDRANATVPVTTFVLGIMLGTVPASFLMQRYGRRFGFMLGAFLGFVGIVLAIIAIIYHSFWLFCLGTAFVGIFQASSQYFRFAAADAATDAFRPKAISLVLTGGVAAAILGTGTVMLTRNLMPQFPFVATYIAAGGFVAATFLILSFLQIPPPPKGVVAGVNRPWSLLLREPLLVSAMVVALTSGGLMTLMMTAAPVAMANCGFGVGDSAQVIQWHVLAMYLPSFVTGSFIKKWGAQFISVIGFIILLGASAVALAGLSFGHFSIALVLLGLGWNFGFIGGTTLLTTTYSPAEKGKVQALNDFLMSLTMAVASFSAGRLLANWSWSAVAWVMIPLLALSLLVLLWGSRRPAASLA